MQHFTGLQYLAIDIANNYGLDKETWDFRLSWFESHKDKILNEPTASQYMNQAEKPGLFFAGITAYLDALAGRLSGYPISLDATASGMQILACLAGDRKAAELCNVLPKKIGGEIIRNDAYTAVYSDMKQAAGKTESLNNIRFPQLTRPNVKQAVMTSLYGSEAVPEEVFGTGELLQLFYRTLMQEAPGAWALNKLFLKLWNPTATNYGWDMPDNFAVRVKIMSSIKQTVHHRDNVLSIAHKVNAPKDVGRCIGANVAHSIDSYIVRELTRRCSYDPEQIMRVKTALCIGMVNQGVDEKSEVDSEDEDYQLVSTLWKHYQTTGMLSARILDHINEDNVSVISDTSVVWKLIYSLPQKPFELICVHDCFRCLPNYGNDLRQQYNNLLADVAKGKLLDTVCSSITGQNVSFTKLDPEMWKEVLHTEYALS